MHRVPHGKPEACVFTAFDSSRRGKCHISLVFKLRSNAFLFVVAAASPLDLPLDTANLVESPVVK